MIRNIQYFPATASAIINELYGVVSRRLLSIWKASPESLPQNALTAALGAASRMYEKGLRIDQERALAERTKLPAHVISVGNMVCGGTGKTPLVMWICRYLAENGSHPAILTRGYGRSGKGAARVIPGGDYRRGDNRLQSALFGDEPVLLASSLPSVPVWVGRRRALSGEAALSEDLRLDTMVLDDGFQHLALDRDLDIVLLDCRNAFGNGRTLPLGPLREPILHLRRADALVLTHSDSGPRFENTKSVLQHLFPEKPIFSCSHRISGFRATPAGVLPVDALNGRRAAAFAGIAGPGGFFESLAQCGIYVCAGFPFPDHHRYSESDLSRIVDAASKGGAEFILTTAKDAVRLPSAFLRAILIADMQLDFGTDEERFREFLRSRSRR